MRCRPRHAAPRPLRERLGPRADACPYGERRRLVAAWPSSRASPTGLWRPAGDALEIRARGLQGRRRSSRSRAPELRVRSSCVFTGGAATRGRRSGGSLRNDLASSARAGRRVSCAVARARGRGQGMSAGRIMSHRCRTPSDLSKDLGDCRVAARLWARWGLGMRRRVRSRRRGESGTSRTSGSGGRARAPSPS